MTLADQVKRVTLLDVGNGRDVLFGEDFWCCPRPLSVEVFVIFNLALDKKASVAECWIREGKEGNWNVTLHHWLNDREI